MKTKLKLSHKNTSAKAFRSSVPSYYFHSDDDFREDRNWGKNIGNERQSFPVAKTAVKDQL